MPPQRMRTNVNGLNTTYVDFGAPNSTAKDLVHLHGLGASSERWLSVAPTLSKYFRVLLPDIVGFGYSDKPTIEYTMDFFVNFFDGFLQNLGIERPHIIASSFGGHLA